MKKIFILTSNGGDGSAYVRATFDESLIAEMDEAYQNDTLDFECWVDGDGFHYEVWNVPDECTPESMGFSPLTRDSVFY